MSWEKHAEQEHGSQGRQVDEKLSSDAKVRLMEVSRLIVAVHKRRVDGEGGKAPSHLPQIAKCKSC